jgi:alpha-L-rhamnosidase
LAFGLLNETQRSQATAHLLADLQKRDVHLSTGFLGTRTLMDALAGSNQFDVAYRLLLNTTFPSWGFTIQNGATSIWERWNGWTPDKGFENPGMNSFSHYAFGAVVQWMFEHVGGIQPLAPGYRRIRIAPRPDDRLQWARTEHDSIHGPIKTAWKQEANRFELAVEVPVDTTAEVHLSCRHGERVTEGGQLITEREDMEVRQQEQNVVVTVGSGRYRFVVSR